MDSVNLTINKKTVTRIFLHGLESSSKGAKASFLRALFPDLLTPDFTGSLSERMIVLETLLAGREHIIMAGSSFGGLMATIYAMENQESVDRLILLAPALNFPEFSSFTLKRVNVPVRIIIGKEDTVTPVHEVFPLASMVFTDLTYDEVDDGHMLANTFRGLDWPAMLTGQSEI